MDDCRNIFFIPENLKLEYDAARLRMDQMTEMMDMRSKSIQALDLDLSVNPRLQDISPEDRRRLIFWLSIENLGMLV